MKFNNPYSRTYNNVIRNIDPNIPSLTDQSLEPQANISTIIKTCMRTGEKIVAKPIEYADLTRNSVAEYQEAAMLLSEYNTAFLTLPAIERERLGDVSGYLKELSDPSLIKQNYEKGFIRLSEPILKELYPDRYDPFINNLKTPSEAEKSPQVEQIEVKETS